MCQYAGFAKVCGYDIACENLSGREQANEIEIVRLNSCEYVVFDCAFDSEASMSQAHEKPDALFWGEWLNENPYISAIDFSKSNTGIEWFANEIHNSG